MSALNLKDGEAVHFDEHGKAIRRSRWKDENGKIIPDGHMLVVPMMMSDAAVKLTDAQVAAEAAAAKFGNSVAVDATVQRPRSASYSDAQNKAREDRQAAYDKRLADQWKGDGAPVSRLDEEELRRTGEIIMTHQAEIAMRGGGGMEGHERRAAVQRYNHRIENAWKGADAVASHAAPAPAPAVADAEAALAAARKRNDNRLENAWKQEGL